MAKRRSEVARQDKQVGDLLYVLIEKKDIQYQAVLLGKSLYQEVHRVVGFRKSSIV